MEEGKVEISAPIIAKLEAAEAIEPGKGALDKAIVKSPFCLQGKGTACAVRMETDAKK